MTTRFQEVQRVPVFGAGEVLGQNGRLADEEDRVIVLPAETIEGFCDVLDPLLDPPLQDVVDLLALLDRREGFGHIAVDPRLQSADHVAARGP